MIVTLSIAIPVLGLTYLVVWALWHLIYDEKTFPEAAPTKKEVDLAELAEEVGYPHQEVPKETPATTWLHIPPPYFSGRAGDRSGYNLGGIGSGGWSFQHKLMPRQYRRKFRQHQPWEKS